MKLLKPKPLTQEVCILVGGLSTRMGRDKSRLRLGPRTLLGHIRAAVRPLGLKIRTIRRDAVPRCGPIGGIYTALKTSPADTILILACDMPFVTTPLLQKILLALRPADQALFTRHQQLAGFPCLLRRDPCLPILTRQIEQGEYSLQKLAHRLQARTLRPPSTAARALTNLNTPADLKTARHQFRQP